ncbi:MAG: hypothetical protein ACP5NW_02520 [Candidatus Woesearchaeota archaeon]
MMKKLSISIFILLLLVASVNAAKPMVKYTSEDDVIDDGDNTVVYKISLTNTETFADKFQFYTISAFWDIDPTIVTVPPMTTYTFDMDIRLSGEGLVGPQLVPVTIKSLASGDTIDERFYVYIRPSNATPMSYVPNVVMKLSMKDELDPREPASIELTMTNRNLLDIKDLRILIDSELFTKEVQTTLGPIESKTNQILLGMNEMQEPGIYNVRVRIVVNNKTVTEVTKELKVIAYSEVTVEQTKIKGLVSYTQRLKVHNNGNYDTVKELRVQKNFFEKIFTTTSTKSTKLKEDGITYMLWQVPLKPQETYEITVKTNYTILVVIIILILAGIVMYYIFRTPVLLFKRAKIIASTEEGITEIRVKLHLKNRSGREVRGVKVIDRYPKIVSLIEENVIGSMKPTKMLSADKSSALLMWNLDVLEPYEERLLSYTVKSHLNIVGNMHLKSAKARFMTLSGERTTNSNDVTLMHKSVNTIKYE